jgi:hypothetical protein
LSGGNGVNFSHEYFRAYDFKPAVCGFFEQKFEALDLTNLGTGFPSSIRNVSSILARPMLSDGLESGQAIRLSGPIPKNFQNDEVEWGRTQARTRVFVLQVCHFAGNRLFQPACVPLAIKNPSTREKIRP